MPLTKADIQDINNAVKSGDIDDARMILELSDDPRAPGMLAKLNAKYPPAPQKGSRPSPAAQQSRPSNSAATDELTEIKALIAQRRYDEAEERLWASTHPDAGDLLKKIALVRSTQSAAKPAAINSSPSKTIVKAKSFSPSRTYGLVAGVAVLLVIIVGGAFLAYSQRDTRTLDEKIEGQLMSVCFYVAVNADSIVKAHLTDDQIIRACAREVRYVMNQYPVAMAQCYDDSGDDDDKWLGCMSDEQSIFSMQYFIEEING